MIHTFKNICVLLCCLLLSFSLSAVGNERGESSADAGLRPAGKAAPLAGETVDWQVVASGATDGSSENFLLDATTGQLGTDIGNSENYIVRSGFWQLPGGTPYLCGDADGNDIVNISDAVYLIAYIFGGGAEPSPLLAGDVDCNGLVNISDAVYLIAYIFGGGQAPCAGCV